MELIIMLVAMFFLAAPLLLLIFLASLQSKQRRLEKRQGELDGDVRGLGDRLDQRTVSLKRRIAYLEQTLGVSPEEGAEVEATTEPAVTAAGAAATAAATPPAVAGIGRDPGPREPADPAPLPAEPAAKPPEPRFEAGEPAAAASTVAARTGGEQRARTAASTGAPPIATRPAVIMPDRPDRDVVRPVAALAATAPTPRAARKPRAGLRPPAGADWEEVIGGDWLNKLGALVLVVGIALLLAYSVARMGPAGRVALGMAVSVAMLIVGVVTERREQYRVFAQGLLGGGWAGLYFTTYAMHGLEAARVIDSPVAGTALLLAVAAGMVAHSLYYRSQAITGLAYFIVFATLAISPLSRFALIASVPAAASLLFVAQRFGWERMAIGGLLLSYGSFLFRYEGLQAASPGQPDWAFGQALLLIYWLMFEAFDLVSQARGRTDQIAYTLFPLNAAGFLGISVIEWSQVSAANLWLFFGLAGVAFLVSALLRARFVPAKELPADAALEDVIAASTYEAAITVATVLFAYGIHLRFDGWQQTVAWLLEAQMLFLSGLRMRQRYLRGLGSLAMMLPVLAVIAIDLAARGQIEVAGMSWQQGTPVALLTAAVLYGSRAVLRATRGVTVTGAEMLFTSFASLILALVIGNEAPAEYTALGWLALAVVLFETSMPAKLAELRYQAYVVSAIAWIDILAVAVLDVLPSPDRIWTLLVPAAVLSYGAALRLYLRPAGIAEAERAPAFDLASLAGSLIVALAVWHMAPVAWVAVGWLLLGLLLVETGLAAGESSLRIWGHVALIAAFGRTFMGNFTNLGDSFGLSHRLVTVGPMIAAYYYLAARLRDGRQDATTMRIEPVLQRGYLYLAAILGAVLIRFELGRAEAVLGWTAMLLVLLYVGRRRDNGDLRLQAYGLAVLVFVRAWATNFYVAGTILGVPGRLLTGVLVTAGLFAARNMVPRERSPSGDGAGMLDRLIGWFDERARSGVSLLATILGAVLIHFELGRAEAVLGWTAMLLVLLYVGRRRDNGDLRLQAYGLAVLVFVRAWATNFYVAGTILGVPGRLLTGVLVTAGLFAAHFMVPREGPLPGGGAGTFDRIVDWFDERARPGLSLLATVLLAVFLFHEVSGSLLTVAWGLQGTGLLIAGFALRDRQLRLSGLVLLGVCIGKAFFYDFRQLDVVFRIISFLVLGSLLLAVSFVYTRYREQLRRWL